MYIHVRVKPGSKREEVVRKSSDHYVIAVREKAERGEANKRVMKIVSSLFDAPARLISGHSSPSKLFSVNRAAGGLTSHSME